MDHTEQQNGYWQGRAWAYGHLLVSRETTGCESADPGRSSSKGSKSTAPHRRKLALPLTGKARQRIRERLRQCTMVGVEAIIYREARARLRPTVGRLFKSLKARDGEPLPVEEAVVILSGGRGSMDSIRMTTFRLSRAFRELKCPLRVCCREQRVFIAPSERGGRQSPSNRGREKSGMGVG